MDSYYIEKAVNFFVNKDYSATLKTSIILTLIVFLFITNDIFQYSTNYRVDKKLNQLQKIEQLLSTTDDTDVIKRIKKMEDEVLSNNPEIYSLPERFISFIKSAAYSIKRITH